MSFSLQYPIGKFTPQPYAEDTREEWIADIRFLPQTLERAIQNLDETQLQMPYREGGWNAHQILHHLADSHMHAFIRFKLALTENNPTIKPFEETSWVHTPDVLQVPVNVSLTLLHALHQRWVILLENMDRLAWERTLYHPHHQKNISLWELLGMYAWHGKHHAAHITSLRERMGW